MQCSSHGAAPCPRHAASSVAFTPAALAAKGGGAGSLRASRPPAGTGRGAALTASTAGARSPLQSSSLAGRLRSQALAFVLTSLGLRSITRLQRRGVAAPTPPGGAAAPRDEDGDDAPAPKAGYLVDFLVKPVLLVVLLSFLFYPILASSLASLLDPTALSVIKGDVSQFMQNFFNYNGLLFSFFASQTYSFLYQQQESMYVALYTEVTEARSLVEQLTLISQNRPSYPAILRSMRDYVQELALGVRSGVPPAVLVAAKPASDPLENILYLTSVGVPSAAYDTVRSLRQARGVRLGASQRKLPPEHFLLLRILGILELLAFPLLGAGISTYEVAEQAGLPGHILWVQAIVFALIAGGVSLTLQVVEDLRFPTSGLYSLDNILDEMVDGLLTDLDERIARAPKTYEIGQDVDNKNLPFGKLSLPSSAEGPDEGQGLLDGEGFLRDPSVGDSIEPVADTFSFSKRILFCIVAGLVAAVAFPVVVRVLRSEISLPALQAIREDNNAQWLQNFFTGIGFIFSLFVAQTFGFLYSQQEQIYFALYAEVSEAKALLEQLTLVCRTRATYGDMLRDLQAYVSEDLERLDVKPTRLLRGLTQRGKSKSDPLENVLYATSVGVPSYVYDTVRGLREARGARLGATQKKLPDAHFVILNVLGFLELSVFPVLAAGCAALEPVGVASRPGHILFFHSILFGIMTAAVTLTLEVLWDLWSPVGETYNLRTIVKEMVSGLQRELALRIEAASPPLEDSGHAQEKKVAAVKTTAA